MLLLGALLLSATRSEADEAPAAWRRQTGQLYTLDACLRLAKRNYPKVAEARARVLQVQAQLDEARFTPFSDFEATAGIGLAPTVRGTNIYSRDTDRALSRNMGLGWQINIGGTIPIWTFGKITNLWEAAEAQVQVKEHELKQAQNEVMLAVRQAYIGALFARDVLILLKDAQERFSRALNQLEQAVEEDEADIIELYKLKMYRAELTARESEARKQERIALAGLRFLTGVERPLELPDEPQPRPTHRLAPLALYLSAARLYRPEVNMARAGVLAREAQLRIEEAKYFPNLGLTTNFSWVQAPEVTDQLNPFVRDPGNYLRFGFAFGLKWKLDFLPQTARRAQAAAKLEEMRATERYALGGVGVEVEKAYVEALDAQTRLDAYAEASDYARRWLITVQQGLDIGAFEDQDLLTPAREYALRQFSEMNATYDYNVALSKLALATGWEAVVDYQSR